MGELTNPISGRESPSVHPQKTVQPPVAATAVGRLRTALATVLVFGGLGGLLAWGHAKDWTLPKFSSLLGTPSDGQKDWCSEHGVPESECVECNAELMPRSKGPGWCKVHGVHECPLEHPEIAQVDTLLTVSRDDLSRAQRALEFAERPENNSKCKAHEHRIQFSSQEAVEMAGIEVEPVWRAPIVEYVATNGEIIYDQTRTARLSPRASGSVFRAFKKVGDPVHEGEVVALVDAADVGKAKAELLKAIVQVRLKRRNLEAMLGAAAAIPERQIREMEADLSEAQIRLTTAQEAMTNFGLPVDLETLKDVPQEKLADRLRFLGLPASLVATLNPKLTTGNLLAVTAPLDGVVIARQVVDGEVVDTSKLLFVVADVRRLWLTLDLRSEDTKAIRLAQKIQFHADGSKDLVEGSIDWISTEADTKTRTVKARAVLDNKAGHMRANTFGTGKVILREEDQAIVVPNSAVHSDGDCSMVFVRDKNYLKPGSPKIFYTRTVRLGAKDERQTEIIAGVLPGEVVATKGSATLRAQLLKENLGEGCGCCKK